MQGQIFADYCKKHFGYDIANYKRSEKYTSLSVCILDCIYSLRAKYYSITVPVIKRYADAYLNGDIYAPESLSDFIKHIEEYPAPSLFASELLKNNQVLCGRNKAEVCLEIAKKLRDLLNIETCEDFCSFPKKELSEIVLRSVKGMGDAGISYLFMLTGEAEKCKPDVHIHRCLKDALGCEVSNDECQSILTLAVSILKNTYPELTVSDLDNIIWDRYQQNKQ